MNAKRVIKGENITIRSGWFCRHRIHVSDDPECPNYDCLPVRAQAAEARLMPPIRLKRGSKLTLEFNITLMDDMPV